MEPVVLSQLARVDVANSSEWARVTEIAGELLEGLNRPDALQRIHDANRPGRSSAEVQAAFLESATRLGFESEKKGLFSDLELALRPDYFRPLGDTGILLEVERGKTTINNMDLLDFWKCHLCPGADYLFLLVPRELRQNPQMSPRKEYPIVEKRLGSFFQEGNTTNVRGLCLFGY